MAEGRRLEGASPEGLLVEGCRLTRLSLPLRVPAQLVRLLETLSSSAPLARLVRRLEIRSYPPPQILTGALSSATLLSFLALPNVSSLAFTRDHSLSPQLLSAIASSMPGLRELEVNAHSAGSFDPRCLVGITGRLERLVLVMPDRGTVGVLEEWVRRVHEEGVRAGRPYPGLRELTILSKVRARQALFLRPVRGADDASTGSPPSSRRSSTTAFCTRSRRRCRTCVR